MRKPQPIPLEIRRLATVLADAMAAGRSVGALPEYARACAWLAKNIDEYELLDLDRVFVAVRYETLANAIEGWAVEEVHDQLGLSHDAAIGPAERRAFVSHVLQQLLDDADISRACSTCVLSTSDGRAVHIGTGRYGYSFSGVGDEWFGAFPSYESFRRAMERDGWIEWVDDLDDAAIAQLWQHLYTEPVVVRPAEVRSVRPGVERYARTGEVLVTLHQLALLQGLLDRPDGVAPSAGDWTRAALPHARRLGRASVGALAKAAARVPEAWVERVRAGRRIEARLTERGRAIVSAAVPVRVVGVGAYRGWAALVREAKRRA
jgi:hypothetical protein